MDLFRKYRSPLGYFMDDEEKRKDSYGVDHSGFSTRDELEYQTARSERENELIQNYNNQGITKDYPQQGTNFWGNPENNYGFGNSNISANIESRKQNQTSLAPQQNQTQNSFASGTNNQSQMMTNNNSQANQTPSNGLSGNNNDLNNNFNNNANNNPYAKLKQWLGQSEQNINSALYPKPRGDDANSYQLAQNNKTLPDITPNTSYENAQDMIFDRVFNKTLGEEGGYEDRPDKIDTATNMGFQQATLERFKQKHPDLAQNFPEQVKDLTREQGMLIARKDYYEPYRIGEIQSPALQESMFDSFFNHSPTAPALWAQKAINQNTNMKIKEDGVFGSETINAMNKLSQDEIVKVNNAILRQRLEDHEREKKTNPNPYYRKYTVGLPDRFKRFEIK